MGRLGQTFLLFFGRGTGPKRSGAVLACFWTDFQAKPSILDPIRAIFDDLGPNRHFGRDLDLQDQARDWPGGPGCTTKGYVSTGYLRRLSQVGCCRSLHDMLIVDSEC